MEETNRSATAGRVWTAFKKFCNKLFIDGLSGMALGLFATLLVGTILAQVASPLVASDIGWVSRLGYLLNTVASVAKMMTGFGIGVGVAVKFKQAPLVSVSAGVCGMIGAFSSQILKGTLMTGTAMTLSGPGEPLGAFVAAFAAVEFGSLVSGKTKVDILVTPVTALLTGSAFGLLLGSPIASFMTWIGSIINWGTEQQPLLMGVVVSVLMGIALTLPISSAAIGISLNLTGIAAGAATIGCCCNMIGFAVASFRENRWGGLVAQGLGTSMLQMPNIIRKPIIWLPAIVSSAILGPISSAWLGMTSNAVGSGMGTCGLVGPLSAFQTMTGEGVSVVIVLVQIVVMYFLLPAALSLGVSEFMRRLGWIKSGDMALDV